MKHDDKVEVWDGRRWQKTFIDALPGLAGEYGWVCVKGWPGRAGPVSMRIEHVRRAEA